jgi:2-hydroxychromene-2-carboxylate isomerase
MTLAFDLYYSFRSPYSYLTTPAVDDLLAGYDCVCRLKVVRPIAVRIPGFFSQVNPLWLPYLARDTRRIAEMNGIPYRWPRPDPIVQNPETREVSKDQPYIMKVSRMGAAAEELGKGFAFTRKAAHMMWSGTVDNWHEGDYLKRAADAAGLDGAALESSVLSDPSRFDAMIIANEEAQPKAGHWGVPLFAFEDECFFGQDRIDHLIWRMKQRGLAPR